MDRVRVNNDIVMSLKTLSIITLACVFIATKSVRAEDVGGSSCSMPGVGTQIKDIKGRVLTHEELFKQLYDEAECLRRAAAAAGAEWLETETLLLRSLEEADEQRWDSALALAEKARFQAGQALRQAEHEVEAWKHRVVK